MNHYYYSYIGNYIELHRRYSLDAAVGINIRTQHYACLKNAAIDRKANRRRSERKLVVKRPNVQIFKCLNAFVSVKLQEVLSDGLFNKLADCFA